MTKKYLIFALFFSLPFAQAGNTDDLKSCKDVPDEILETYVDAWNVYKSYVNPAADRSDALRFSRRISYAYGESTFYPLASNDESSKNGIWRGKGIEIAQDLAREDNKKWGGYRSPKTRASLSSYEEIFKRSPYVLKHGDFATGWMNKVHGRKWQKGDVGERFDVVMSTNFGLLQVSPDQYNRGAGAYRKILKWVIANSKEYSGAKQMIEWCNSKEFYKDSKRSVAKKFMELANSGCDPTAHNVMCFGRWQLLCPTYNVLLGSNLSERYYASNTRRKSKLLCEDKFR